MTAPNRGPVVVDTDVYSALLVPDSSLARRYDPLLVGRPVFLSFQTVAELRFGALRRGWGTARLRRLEAEIARDGGSSGRGAFLVVSFIVYTISIL